ncbi:MAG: hypothetical protein ACXWNZ_05965 [Vulcanimicrobiaceae bacterium]
MARGINRIVFLAIMIACIVLGVRGSNYFALIRQPLLSFLCGLIAAISVMILALLLLALAHPTLKKPRRR